MNAAAAAASPATGHTPATRGSTPFSWSVTAGMDVYAGLAGVRFDRLFLEADAIVHAYEIGMPKARELFGPEVTLSEPRWAAISYGHVNCLGCPLIFPLDSEVAHRPIYRGFAQGVTALRRDIDWAGAGKMPFYLALWEKLKAAFPRMRIPFVGLGLEGPITTAWELRGHEFFEEVYDDPQLTAEYLQAVTDSINSYHRFLRRINGLSPMSADGAVLCDDVSAMLSPDRWPQYVLPYQEAFFCGQTTGPRWAHIEDLVPAHLHHLDALRLDQFDPSVSPRLRPADLRDRCRVPFMWRLNAMQIRDYSPRQVRDMVFEAGDAGASRIFCSLSRTTVSPEAVEKVRAFIEAVKEVKARRDAGTPSRVG